MQLSFLVEWTRVKQKHEGIKLYSEYYCDFQKKIIRTELYNDSRLVAFRK